MKLLGFFGWMVAGLGLAGAVSGATTVFGPDTEWRWKKGIGEASAPDATAWRSVGFDDRGWSVGPAPFFYGEALSGTELPDMRGGYTCVYLRKAFSVSEPSALGAVRLRALSDDGFAAWINGKPVVRFNMPDGDLDYDTTASGTFAEPIPTETYEVADFANILVAGNNVLAVQACNVSISGSSDFVFEASLETEIDDVPPVVVRVLPAAGSRMRELRQVTVLFSEPVEGVDAGDLSVDGVGATAVTGFGGDQYVFEFAPPAEGTVQVAWAADAGIRDLSVRRNPFGGGRWEYTVDPNLPPPGVTISEFMADNEDTLNDEDGDPSDWIEIENASEQVVDLAGWALTDDATVPMRWKFGQVTLDARSRLVVFASGKDRVGPTGRLHTNFRLSRAGGYLALMRPDGGVASAFAPAYPEQSEDVSYGRLPTDPTRTGYFVDPTPGSPNGEGGAGFAPEVEFSRIGGTFLEPFDLTLRARGTATAVVRYTLDGSVPTEASREATGAIRIEVSTRVRARTFSPGLFPGRLTGEYYVQLNPTAASATSTLPLVLIHAYGGGGVPANGEYPVFVSMYEPRGGVSSLTNAPDLRSRARLNIRGSSTLFQEKRNYSLEFRDEREADRDLAPLGLPSESDWVLYAPNNFEPILIHNPYIFHLSRAIGRYAPRTRFVEAYVQTGQGSVTSSHYAGIYVLMEKIKRGPDRVDVAELEPEHVRGPQVTGGYLLKVDRLDPGDSGLVAGGQSMGFVEPKEPEMRSPQRAPQHTYIRDYIDRFGQALNSANWRDPVVGWRAFVDEGSWIDHHLLNVVAFNVDALRLSAYFYKPREGKLAFGPIWDFDRALNSTDGRDSNPRTWRSTTSDMGTDFFNYPWWGRMFRDPDFWQKYIDRYQELRRGAFETNSMFRLIDDMTGQVRAAQPREAARWPGFTTPRGSYANEIAQLKFWLLRRIHFMDTNFLAAPVASTSPEGGTGSFRVTLTGPPGATIRYTTDGTDPRAPGGEVAATSREYSGPISVGETGWIRARAHHLQHRNLTGANNPPISSPWSGPLEVRGATVPGALPRRLWITEVHANPAPPNAAELAIDPALTAADFEFVELLNPGRRGVDLGDLRFTEGLRYDFATGGETVLAPGARAVLVRHRGAFTARYGARGVVLGEYSGGLDAAGETLRIDDGLGGMVATARYRTAANPAADGLGFSLVLRDETGDVEGAGAREEDWRVSRLPGGSPGTEDGAPPEPERVVIEEVLTHTDLPLVDGVELFNAGATPARLDSWYLTDDRSRPFKYRFPEGTIVPPGGYLWVDESRFAVDTSSTVGFRLDSTGDQVWLFAADAGGRLTGYAHGFDFGAVENGVSFGRELDCSGRESLWPQASRTPGAANTGPRPAALMISEVHYRPKDIAVGFEGWDDDRLEFVEIANVTDSPVALYDAAHPTHTWRLKDAVDFAFPIGQTLPPRGVVVVVPFDPATNPQAVRQFRSLLGVAAGVTLLGPYEGSLPNGSGKVELARPDAPDPVGISGDVEVPYVVVDRVNYFDEAPWTPLADGTGWSLHRLEWTRPGAGPRSWRAATPSPGRIADGSLDGDGDGMPDGWEAVHCLDPNERGDGVGDADGDRARNIDEYRVRTNPSDAADVLGWAEMGADPSGRPRWGFVAKAGISYVVEVADVLTPGGWRELSRIPAADERAVTIEDSPASGLRFYRVQSPGIP